MGVDSDPTQIRIRPRPDALSPRPFTSVPRRIPSQAQAARPARVNPGAAALASDTVDAHVGQEFRLHVFPLGGRAGWGRRIGAAPRRARRGARCFARAARADAIVGVGRLSGS